jgi:hypothetical protein
MTIKISISRLRFSLKPYLGIVGFMLRVKIAYFVLGFILLFPAAFCLFGLLASREPGTSISWVFGYGVALINFLAFSIVCFRKGMKYTIKV